MEINILYKQIYESEYDRRLLHQEVFCQKEIDLLLKNGFEEINGSGLISQVRGIKEPNVSRGIVRTIDINKITDDYYILKSEPILFRMNAFLTREELVDTNSTKYYLIDTYEGLCQILCNFKEPKNIKIKYFYLF